MHQMVRATETAAPSPSLLRRIILPSLSSSASFIPSHPPATQSSEWRCMALSVSGGRRWQQRQDFQPGSTGRVGLDDWMILLTKRPMRTAVLMPETTRPVLRIPCSRRGKGMTHEMQHDSTV